MKTNSLEIIQNYYHYFNQNNWDGFFSLLDDQVVHDINQGERQIGKVAFQQFMAHMQICYQEQISDLVVMISDDGQRASAEFIVEGTYLTTDSPLPPAQKQTYRLPVGAFFEIKNGKITRVTNYYNLQNWLDQIQ